MTKFEKTNIKLKKEFTQILKNQAVQGIIERYRADQLSECQEALMEFANSFFSKWFRTLSREEVKVFWGDRYGTFYDTSTFIYNVCSDLLYKHRKLLTPVRKRTTTE